MTARGEMQSWHPSRLVQIDMASSVPMSIRVIESAEYQLGSDTRYTTLSYCWGPPPITFKRLLRANIDDMRAGIDITTLPKTFQDAIKTTARLGINLIWIDALCIVQDSDEDWRKESVQMSRVYSQAYINLAAAASTYVYGGLFRERNPFSLSPFDLKVKWPGFLERSVCCVPEDPWVSAIDGSPLLKRAWTFQERLLSARTVYFAKDQLYWECGELCASEICPVGGPFDPGGRETPPDHTGRLPKGIQRSDSGRIKDQYALFKSWGGVCTKTPGFLQVWGSIVENYSKGRLTFPRDRLVAISGVAKELSDDATEKDYVLGLWRSHFALLLLWKDMAHRKTLEDDHPLAPSGLGPSWSWSSHLNPVSYSMLFMFQTDPEICAEVLNIDITPGINAFLQEGYGTGRLVIKAPMIEAKVSRVFRRRLNGPLSLYFYIPGQFERTWAPFCIEPDALRFVGKGLRISDSFDVYFDSDLDFATHPDVFLIKVAAANTKTWLGELSTDFGLILSHTGRKGQYKRVGCFALVHKELTRSWRAGQRSWRRRLWSKKHLMERLFEAGEIDQWFYQKFDGVGAYTIEIV